MRVFLAVFLSLSLFAARPAPPKKRKRLPSMEKRVAALLKTNPVLARSHVGIRLLTLQGKVLYEHNPKSWFIPASNTKLYTTALALTRLGANYRMITRLTSAAPPDAAGVLRGDLRLVGGGDPSFSGRAYPYDKKMAWADEVPGLDDLAAQLAARGVKRIEGSVIGDDTAYVWDPFPNGWGIDDPLYEYGAPVSALTFQDNAIRLHVAPGNAPGQPAEITVGPELGQLALIPSVTTLPTGERGRIRTERDAFTTELRVHGGIGFDSKPYETWLAVEDPALYAARALQSALEGKGIAVTQPAGIRHRRLDEDPGPDYPHILAERRSRPLGELVQVVNKVSQNLHAELLLREAGRLGKPFGSREAGIDAMREFLTKDVGLDKQDVNFEDGSGLSRLTLSTPEATTKLLRFMAASSVNDAWTASLPIGGDDGTLERRFDGFEDAKLVHAKTGSLTHVSALAGYLNHARRGRLIFAVMVNNYNAPAREARQAIDKLVMTFLE